MPRDYKKMVNRIMRKMSGHILPSLICVGIWLAGEGYAFAAILNQPMTGATAPGWVIGGNAYLTASTGEDPAGSGWLRLTDPGTYEAGYAYYDTAFDISQGAVIQYDYATWGGNGADGYSIYLFDSSYTFSIGATGGSLGYANRTGYNGMAGGYIGIGVDEYGNYSAANEGKSGGIGFSPNAVAVRGPASSYTYLGGSGSLAQDLAFSALDYRPNQSGAQYRKVVIYLTPVASPNYLRIDIYVQFGAGQTLTPVATGVYTGQSIPASVKVGYAASTGGQTNYHEIRNLVVSSLPNNIDLSMTKTVSSPTIAPGGTVTYTLTATNLGPSGTTATNAAITDTIYTLSGVTWTCAGTPGATCGAASGSGSLSTTAAIPFNGAVTYTVTGTVPSGTAPGTVISNTATVSAPSGLTDYNTGNNSSTVSTLVTSGTISVSGTAFNDTGHDGVMDIGESGATGIGTYYAKIFRSSDLSTAVAVAQVSTANGTYTLTGVPAYGTYTIILSSTSTTTAFDPSLPNANWIYTQPVNYTLTNVTAAGSSLTGQNFGIYRGARISGRVINDNGAGGGSVNANDAILNGSEAGIPGVTVTLRNNTGGTIYDTAVTDSGGNFALFYNGTSRWVRIYEINNPANYVSVNAYAGTTGGTYALASDYIEFYYYRYTDYSGIVFSDVQPNTFTPTPSAADGSSLAPVYYPHTFTPGSGGSVIFSTVSRSQGTWPALVYYQDTGCSGVFNVADPVITPGVTSITATAGVPVCILVKDTIPGSALNGASDAIVTRATFTYTNSPGPLSSSFTVSGTTTVVYPPILSVLKEVSTDGGANFSTSPSPVNPGATLTYRITVTNSGTGNATNVVIVDPKPTYTTYVAGSAKRATGATPSTYAAAPTTLTDGTDGDGYDFDTTLGAATYNVGTIAPGPANAVQLFLRVTVN